MKKVTRILPKSRSWACSLSEWASLAEDERELKVSDSMTNTEDAIREAISNAGWTWQNDNAEYDFYLEHVWEDSCVVVDVQTGKYYKISYTVSDGTATLGVPEETDLTFVPVSTEGTPTIEDGGEGGETPEGETEPEPEPETEPVVGAAGKSKRTKSKLHFQGTRVSLVQKPVGGVTDSRPVYDVLIASSGFTCDGRYIQKSCMTGAVEKGLFDNVRCFWGHPKPGSGGYREEPPIGFVRAGTARAVGNLAGGIDVFAHVVLFRPDRHERSKQMQEILDASLDEGVALTRNSLYGDVVQRYVDVEGRTVLAWEELLGVETIDFLDTPAHVRTGVRERVSASRTNDEEGELTVSEKAKLDQLEKDVAEMKATNQAQADAAKKANDELAKKNREDRIKAKLEKTTLPKYVRSLVVRQLSGIEDDATIDREIEALAADYVSEIPNPSRGNSSANGGGNGSPTPDDALASLPENVRATVAKAAAGRGIDQAALATAAKQAMDPERPM